MGSWRDLVDSWAHADHEGPAGQMPGVPWARMEVQPLASGMGHRNHDPESGGLCAALVRRMQGLGSADSPTGGGVPFLTISEGWLTGREQPETPDCRETLPT